QAYSNEKDGSFLVCLPSGNQYMLKVAKENYLFHSSHFELAKGQAAAQYEIEIRLAPVKTGAEVTLKNVFFETASASLSPASIFELKTLLNLLITYPALNIQLNGHTDSEGELAYNLDLSTRRAKAVYQYLIDNGIPESRLAFKGYGESKPIDSNDTETGRKNNRRTTFEVTSIN
ncbi:MAG: outer membrane protein OmpA-like peptidoglycan-associated protein, partial [Limisphaerales bacterium]